MAEKDEFVSIIEAEANKLRLWGRINYFSSHAVGWLIVISSVIAGGGGLAGLLEPDTAQAIALMPAALVLISQRQKFGQRANWYYKKYHALNGILDAVRFEGADVAAASKSKRLIDSNMEEVFPLVDESVHPKIE